MATLVIRNLDATLHARLKARAAAEGRSMEEEARLAAARRPRRRAAPPSQTWATPCARMFGPGSAAIELPTARASPGSGRRPTSPARNGTDPTR